MNREPCTACARPLARDERYRVEASPIPFAGQSSGTSYALCADCHSRWSWDVLEAAQWEGWRSDPTADEAWIAALRDEPLRIIPSHP